MKWNILDTPALPLWYPVGRRGSLGSPWGLVPAPVFTLGVDYTCECTATYPITTHLYPLLRHAGEWAGTWESRGKSVNDMDVDILLMMPYVGSRHLLLLFLFFFLPVLPAAGGCWAQRPPRAPRNSRTTGQWTVIKLMCICSHLTG